LAVKIDLNNISVLEASISKFIMGINIGRFSNGFF